MEATWELYRLYGTVNGLVRKIGKPKPFSDLLIAAMCINRGEELLTGDMDFKDIERVSELKVTFVGI